MIHDYIYDFETYPNVITVSFSHVHSDVVHRFEISDRKNDLLKLVSFCFWLRDIKARIVGFNNIGFDYIILHYILTNYANGITYQHIYGVSQEIFATDWNDRFSKLIWPSDWIIDQIDLFKIHHFDNQNKSASLKYLEFQMRLTNIKDLPFPPGTVLTSPQIDELIIYNDDDIFATKMFYFETLPLLRFREELTERYGKNFINASDKKIGTDYFIMKLEEAIPGSCTKINGQLKQTHHASIDLKDAVFPYVRFEHPEFNRVLEFFNAQTIYETKGVFDDLTATIDGFTYVFGVGGIHGSVDCATIVNDDEYMITDIDVKSYYPNLGIANRLFPEHLSDVFCDIYKDVYEQRKTYTKDQPENQMLKLALNGVYGDSNSKYSPFFDSLYMMKITINGQLLLCMLAEQMHKIPDLIMIQINTDGMAVKHKRSDLEHIRSLCRWWEGETHLELEEVEYKRMFIRDVNNYIAEPVEGKLKHKGVYQVLHPRDRKPLGWHQDTSAMVVAHAAEAALVHNVDIKTFILNHKDLYDFCCIAKVPRSCKLVMVGLDKIDIQTQNTTRYHVSLVGPELVKIMPPLPKVIKVNPNAPDRRFGIAKGFKVTVCNDINDARPDLINYEWYIQETRKLVDRIKNCYI